jgi:hypothetical protein
VPICRRKSIADKCKTLFYSTLHSQRSTMIQSFRHKGLKLLFEEANP